ncbi:LOW QUALITY PROTEIN: hypothetical protein HID58_080187 [Brassica napus]|uniref:Plastid lipid-associated protein/fibrillin conserved domain-containing protein n=1 Tax=Brassica napus TaxID=3708 RepID=A0ABQ7Y705_BRANA|nr:LOW QUALITY PROTEIN: hypothetical protein HID58_080187 [Brassica napus]
MRVIWPELPEVDAAEKAIEVELSEKINRFINTEDTKVIDGISPFDFEISILRKIWLELDSPTFPPFQFGNISETSFGFCSVSSKYQRMIAHVWLVLYTSKALQLLSTKGEICCKVIRGVVISSKFFVELDDGLELSFTNRRKFAKVRYLGTV